MVAKSEIACRVLDGEDAGEIILAENLLRMPTHPADQFEAFRAMSEAGKGVEDIAARLGTSTAIVKQRLKFASVIPLDKSCNLSAGLENALQPRFCA